MYTKPFWLPCPNNERYEVSSEGGVRNIKTKHELRGRRHSVGYRLVNLHRGPGRRDSQQCYVHRLIAEAFHGKPELGMEVNHINGVKDDNRAENLEWVTRSENVLHAFRIGLHKPVNGIKSGRAKLNEVAVRVLRYFEGKKTQRQLGCVYGVNHTTVNAIQKRRLWKHVQ